MSNLLSIIIFTAVQLRSYIIAVICYTFIIDYIILCYFTFFIVSCILHLRVTMKQFI